MIEIKSTGDWELVSENAQSKGGIRVIALQIANRFDSHSRSVPEEVLVGAARVLWERVSLQVQREVPVGHGVGAGAESGDERRAHGRHRQREVEVAVGQVAPEACDRLVVDRHRVVRLLQSARGTRNK